MLDNKLFYNDELRDKNGVVYSVDMVRYKLKVCPSITYHDKNGTPLESNPMEELNRWMMKTDTFGDVDVKYYSSFGRGYRHLWVLKFPMDESTVSFGLGQGDKKDDLRVGFLEYNPNKVNSVEFKRWYYELRGFLDTFELVRWDCACDFLCQRPLCRLDMNNLRSYELRYENGTYTEYTGVRNKPGRVKLYDKRAESGLDYDLTRVEYTFDNAPVWDSAPKVLLSPVQMELGLYDTELNSTMRALVSVLLTLDAPMRCRALKDVSFRTRKKIEPYLGETTLKLDVACMTALLNQLLREQI